MPFDHCNYNGMAARYSQENETTAPRKRKTTFSCQATTTEASARLGQAGAVPALPKADTGLPGRVGFVLDTQRAGGEPARSSLFRAGHETPGQKVSPFWP